MSRLESQPVYAAVIGDPVSQSISPKLFSEFFELARPKNLRQIHYHRYAVSPSELESFISVHQKNQIYLGFNVTIPHKEEIAKYMDSLSPEARAVRACNVVSINTRGAKGWNTDVFGIQQTLKLQSFRLSGKSAVIIGAGGAARAVAYALIRGGVKKLLLTNRTASRLRSFAKDVRNMAGLCKKSTQVLSVPRLQNQDLSTYHLYVHTTPAGMNQIPYHLQLPKRINPNALAFDLIYKPKRTKFLKESAERGVKHQVGGLDMLIWQAIRTYEIWFKKMNNADQVFQKIKLQLESRGR